MSSGRPICGSAIVAVTFRTVAVSFSFAAFLGTTVHPGQIALMRPPQYSAVCGASRANSFFNVRTIPYAIAAFADA
jgi:hypothetical protein